MIINSENYQIGNKAMASVLLLYYHLINEGGFMHSQTVYIDPAHFDGFDFLDVRVDEDKDSAGIDESLLREGAVIYVLCCLNDMIAEYDNDYLEQELTKKIIKTYEEKKLIAINETEELFDILKVSKDRLDYKTYGKCLSRIYKTYVLGRFEKIVSQHCSEGME